jgi:hypothetical protein
MAHQQVAFHLRQPLRRRLCAGRLAALPHRARVRAIQPRRPRLAHHAVDDRHLRPTGCCRRVRPVVLQPDVAPSPPGGNVARRYSAELSAKTLVGSRRRCFSTTRRGHAGCVPGAVPTPISRGQKGDRQRTDDRTETRTPSHVEARGSTPVGHRPVRATRPRPHGRSAWRYVRAHHSLARSRANRPPEHVWPTRGLLHPGLRRPVPTAPSAAVLFVRGRAYGPEQPRRPSAWPAVRNRGPPHAAPNRQPRRRASTGDRRSPRTLTTLRRFARKAAVPTHRGSTSPAHRLPARTCRSQQRDPATTARSADPLAR